MCSMTQRKGQDELTRRARLNEGGCPQHATPLQVDDCWEQDGKRGASAYCPRRDCVYTVTIKEGTKVWKAVMLG